MGPLMLFPGELLTKELLLMRDLKGCTVAHAAAAAGRLSQVPPSLLTLDVLTVRDPQHRTVRSRNH